MNSYPRETMKIKVKNRPLTEPRSTRRGFSLLLCLRENILTKTFLFSAALFLIPWLAMADPSVSNVRAAQQAGTNLVDIYYNLNGETAAWVGVEISSDNGATYTVPATASRSSAAPRAAAATPRRTRTTASGSVWPAVQSPRNSR